MQRRTAIPDQPTLFGDVAPKRPPPSRPARRLTPIAPPKLPRHGAMRPVVSRAVELLMIGWPGCKTPSALSGNITRIERTGDGWMVAHWTSRKTLAVFARYLNGAFAEAGGRLAQHVVDGEMIWQSLDCGNGARAPSADAPIDEAASFKPGTCSLPAAVWALAFAIGREADGIVDPIRPRSMAMRGAALVVSWASLADLHAGGDAMAEAWGRLGDGPLRHEIDGVAVG